MTKIQEIWDRIETRARMNCKYSLHDCAHLHTQGTPTLWGYEELHKAVSEELSICVTEDGFLDVHKATWERYKSALERIANRACEMKGITGRICAKDPANGPCRSCTARAALGGSQR